MKVVRVPDLAALGRAAADAVFAELARRPDPLLVFPTGRTPLGLFALLVAAARGGRIDFGAARFLVLDDYAGIGADDPRSLTLWLRRELLDPLGIRDEAVIGFDAKDRTGGAARIEAAILAAGGIDLAILGLGPNGHLGLNEPGSAFDSRTRRVTLTPESIGSNAAYWGSEEAVPREAFTLGLGTLFESRRLVLLANGAAKAEIVARTLSGPIGVAVPSTMLRLHPDATLIADDAALAGTADAT
jgi:glucosamine-6-phosphate deaminase